MLKSATRITVLSATGAELSAKFSLGFWQTSTQVHPQIKVRSVTLPKSFLLQLVTDFSTTKQASPRSPIAKLPNFAARRSEILG